MAGCCGPGRVPPTGRTPTRPESPRWAPRSALPVCTSTGRGCGPWSRARRTPGRALPGWTLGFSSPVPAASELPGADAQAGRALERAVASEAPAVVHSAAHTLHSLVSAPEAHEHAWARFAPLTGAG